MICVSRWRHVFSWKTKPRCYCVLMYCKFIYSFFVFTFCYNIRGWGCLELVLCHQFPYGCVYVCVFWFLFFFIFFGVGGVLRNNPVVRDTDSWSRKFKRVYLTLGSQLINIVCKRGAKYSKNRIICTFQVF
jgi:hypothetical protein